MYRRRWFWIAAGLVVLAIGVLYGANVFQNLKSGGLNDPSSASAKESDLLQQQFPKSRVSIILLASSQLLTVDQPGFQTRFLRIISAINADPSQPTTITYYDMHLTSLVSRDRHSTIAIISVSGDQDAAYLRIQHNLK